MDRSLTVAMANVESLLRQVLAATQALFVETDALMGLSHGTTTPNLLPTKAVTRLHFLAQALVLSAQACLTTLVESRFRIGDWIAWMRATGSNIKARGTAPNSAQRDNAKKRRMTDAALQRVLECLTQQQEAFLPLKLDANTTWSSHIMGLKANQYWDANRERVSFSAGNEVATLPHALEQMAQAARVVFDAPRKYLTPFLYQMQIMLPSMSVSRSNNNNNNPIMTAVGTRQGAQWNDQGGKDTSRWKFPAEDSSGYFRPAVSQHDATKRVQAQSQWSIIAQGVGSRVSMYAVPLKSNMLSSAVCGEPLWDEFDSDEEDDEARSSGRNAMESFYLSTCLEFPDDSQVEDVVFFGDDDKSALYADPTKPVAERRQGLGILLHRLQGEESSLELWVLPSYDEAAWEMKDLQFSEDDISKAHLSAASENACCFVVAGEAPNDNDDVNENDASTLYAKTRVLSTSALSETSSVRLFISGSRGIAAVVENQTTHARLGIWDLQEDEEIDEDEEMLDDD